MRYQTSISFYPKEAKQLTLNVLGRVRKECGKSASIRSIVRRTALLTGVSERAIFKWAAEHEKNGMVGSPQTKLRGGKNIERVKKFDDFDLGVLRRIVHNFYTRNEVPTLKKLKAHFNESEDLPNVSSATVSRMLKKIGFRYRRRSRNAYLIEAPNIIQWRCKYLRQMREFRQQGRPIYYTDETWINAGHFKTLTCDNATVASSSQEECSVLATGFKQPGGKSERLIITHCGNEKGFIDGAELVFLAGKRPWDYQQAMNGPDYEMWFRDTLLPKLPPNSVIVMDNASCHLKTEMVPRMGMRKEDMQQWLTSKGVAWEKDMAKAELLSLLATVKAECDDYRVDQFAAQAGHVVLRLPPYHCQLNPIKLIWSHVKAYIASKNKTFRIADIERLVYEAFAHVTPETWAHCVRHVIDEEAVMRELDHVIDDVMDNFVINLSCDGASDSDNRSVSGDELGCRI